MPAVFDEQARHLGSGIGQLSGGPDGLAPPSVDVLRRGDLIDGEGVCLGPDLERLLCNAELAEKCAEAYVLARLAGGRIRQVPFYVRYIAVWRPRVEQRDAARRS